MKLLFATGNAHKVEEVNKILPDHFEVKSLKDLGILEDIPETSETLEGNAIQKVQYLFDRYQKDCFSEDTGLEIDFLDGAPGVYTARFAGPERDANANMDLVLEKLQSTDNRKARFRTVVALIINKELITFEGIVNGRICEKKSGIKGFGYDPIFQPNGYDITFAEMNSKEKNKISHRGRAIQKLIVYLKSNY